MAAHLGDPTIQIVFSRAFLTELERGNLQNATLFARALLRYRESAPPPGT